MIVHEKEKEKEFQPFTLEITLETEQEARLFWHIFNRNCLKQAIFTDGYGSNGRYIEDMSNSCLNEIDADNILNVIESKVKIEKGENND